MNDDEIRYGQLEDIKSILMMMDAKLSTIMKCLVFFVVLAIIGIAGVIVSSILFLRAT